MPDQPQGEVERFRHIPDLHAHPHAKLVPDPDGPWVRATDYDALASTLQTEEAANRWLSWAIGEWAAKANA